MTRAEKLNALRRYVLAGRTDAVFDIRVGTVTFEDEVGQVSTTSDDLDRVRAEIAKEASDDQKNP